MEEKKCSMHFKFRRNLKFADEAQPDKGRRIVLIGNQFAALVIFNYQFAAETGAGIQTDIQPGEDRTGSSQIYRDKVILTDTVRGNPLAIQTKSK